MGPTERVPDHQLGNASLPLHLHGLPRWMEMCFSCKYFKGENHNDFGHPSPTPTPKTSNLPQEGTVQPSVELGLDPIPEKEKTFCGDADFRARGTKKKRKGDRRAFKTQSRLESTICRMCHLIRSSSASYLLGNHQSI